MAVAPDGPLDAPLVIVGRDPGWQEVAAGKPFVGEAGRVLSEALADASLRRSDILVTNVVNKRPPKDEWGAHSDADIREGVDALRELLLQRQHAPSLVVALGAQACYACITGEAPPRGEAVLARLLQGRVGGTVSDVRGYMFDGAYKCPVLAAVHPAFALRTWLPWRATLSWDFGKAARYLAGERRGQRVSRYARSLLEAEMLVTRLIDAPMLAVDIEGANAPECVAVAADETAGYTFIMPRDRDAIAALLACPAGKIWQNGQFDLTILKRNGFTVAGEQHDIMLLFHAWEPLIAGRSGDGASGAGRKRLSFLASIFTQEPWWKNYDFQSEEEKWQLNATDARVTMEIWQRLSPLSCGESLRFISAVG